MWMYNRLGWESIASSAGVMLMQFSLTEVVMLGVFLLALLTYLKNENNPPRLTACGLFSGIRLGVPTQNVVQGVGWPSGSLFLS